MATLYCESTGNKYNSGSRDTDLPLVSGVACLATGNIVSLSGSPDLSQVIISGANQDSICISAATNTNRIIFFISAVDDVNKTVSLEVAPTGTLNTWSIGGRNTDPSIIVNIIRAGDTLWINDNVIATLGMLQRATAGGGTTSTGLITLKGKSGGLRKITGPAGAAVFTDSSGGWWIENIEFAQIGSVAHVIGALSYGSVLYKCKINGAGTGTPASSGILYNTRGVSVINCEITGNMLWGINMQGGGGGAILNYIHDLSGGGTTGTGIVTSQYGHHVIEYNIIRDCAVDGILLNYNAAQYEQTVLLNNIVYHNAQNGLRNAYAGNTVIMLNNIFLDNGTSGIYYNVKLVNNSNAYVSKYNCFSQAGGRGGASFLNFSADSTDITSDPLFVSATGNDFRLQAGSPCKAAGFPGTIQGMSVAGYMDIGTLQRQESASGGGGCPIIGSPIIKGAI